MAPRGIVFLHMGRLSNIVARLARPRTAESPQGWKIQSLPDEQKAVARKAFADSLSTMWILYVAFAVVGLAVSLLITRNKLDKQHEETKTGIEAEKAKRLEREAERAERRKKRASKGSLPLDPEAQASDPDVSRDKETTA